VIGVKLKSHKWLSFSSRYGLCSPAQLQCTVFSLTKWVFRVVECCSTLGWVPAAMLKASGAQRVDFGSSYPVRPKGGLMSRLIAGHGRTLTVLVLKKACVTRAVWQGALSCWKIALEYNLKFKKTFLYWERLCDFCIWPLPHFRDWCVHWRSNECFTCHFIDVKMLRLWYELFIFRVEYYNKIMRCKSICNPETTFLTTDWQ
jgi:hypothetical protein